jgi:hypothetical protein
VFGFGLVVGGSREVLGAHVVVIEGSRAGREVAELVEEAPDPEEIVTGEGEGHVLGLDC